MSPLFQATPNMLGYAVRTERLGRVTSRERIYAALGYSKGTSHAELSITPALLLRTGWLSYGHVDRKGPLHRVHEFRWLHSIQQHIDGCRHYGAGGVVAT